MKKELIGILFLMGVLFLPLILAEESVQNYQGFDRFIDNTKLFFSSEENKVNLALDIREKEINSALGNLEDSEKFNKNLERARNKLLLIQEKVSNNNAEEVQTNVNELKERLNEHQDLPEEFETYLLEEEKTQLTAELVVEVDGKEGQTLTREVVKDGTTGQNKVRIVVEGDNGEQKIIEIEGKIVQIENQIAERVVKIDLAGQIDKADLEEGVYIAKGEGNGDEGLRPEVKTDVDEGTIKNEVVEKQEGGASSGASGDKINETYDEGVVRVPSIDNEGDCGDGIDCGDGSAEPGVEGVQEEPTSPGDPNEEDTLSITGSVIGVGDRESFLERFIKRILG